MTTTVAAEGRSGAPASGQRTGSEATPPPGGAGFDPSSPATVVCRRRWRPVLRGGLPRTVPSRLRLLRAVVLVTAAGLVGVLVTGGVSASGSWADIRERSAPQVTSATGLYFTLNDMDAQLANQLMMGDTASLSSLRAQAADIYGQRRGQAGGYLRDLAEAAKGDAAAERTVASAISDLGAYEEHAVRALVLGEQSHRPAGQADPKAVAEYTLATQLMRTRLLPEADRLVTTNNAAFEHTYADATGTQSAIRVALLVTGLLMLALLAALQLYLAARFHRVINPGAAAATVLVLTVLVSGFVQISGQQDHLRAARRDAFDSVVALTRARAVSYDANADESRYLLDRAGTTAHEQDFLAKSQRLLHLDGATIGTYDTDLASALRAYKADHARLDFTGFFGDEFRNITFPGERAAAERVLTAYQVYQRDDRRIRALASAGKVAEAIEYCTSHTTGDSNYAFDAYDKALLKLITINTTAFDRTSSDGAGNALTMPVGLAGGVMAAAGLMLIGLRPRLAEFR
ncbi:hypothetical protein [Actinacidiphila oryziradicis]|uniref:Secreted protein n=1 Tax=Actinacidiphila oryziradicis TaxID=2571141 RepID=A0A4U0S2E5_9ACTN|nr:hypothetical protein [Actinacidiphila oryziradicis]TKA01211.1 hypothetical protein FCI23_40830 [Actinacidiphila oryziradicis]